MSGRDPNRPVIIKKVIEEGHHGHHGGAWKVAYADFVTAMMAFFLLMWLLTSANKAKLQGLAEYFTDPSAYLMSLEKRKLEGGAGGILQGVTIQDPSMIQQPVTSPFNITPAPPQQEGGQLDIDIAKEFAEVREAVEQSMQDDRFEEEAARREQERFDEAKRAIVEALRALPELEQMKESLIIDQTPEGLRIQLVDREQVSMFPSGSDQMYPPTRKLIELVVKAIAGLPNKVSIRGHTDAVPFTGVGNDNWRLSSGRANAARQAMLDAGLAGDRIADVIGKADTEPLLPEAPRDPKNRRLSFVLLHDAKVSAAVPGVTAPADASGQSAAPADAGPTSAPPAEPGAPALAPPAGHGADHPAGSAH